MFLDRDGVLNRTFLRDGVTRPPSALSELELLPGVPDALGRLKDAGYLLIVVTNQPDVARGTQSRERVEEMHAWLRERLPLDAVRACYHDGSDGCACRKPRPGLLLEEAARLGVDLSRSVMVGDRGTDVHAGRAAGCATILVGTPDPGGRDARPDRVAADLAEAVGLILGDDREEDEDMNEPVPSVAALRVKIFADGADAASMIELGRRSHIAGFTTNPTLMRKAGVVDYRAFAREVLAAVPDRPISFEVLADELPEMERQAREIASWGPNVYVKIPVTNTRRETTSPLVRRLAGEGVHVNVTAVFTLDQVRAVAEDLARGPHSYVSVFAGRIADTGRDPAPLMARAVELLRPYPQEELIWASPRELLNVFQADAIGCHVITATSDVLAKLGLVGKDLDDFSLDTVKMFHDDAQKADFRL